MVITPWQGLNFFAGVNNTAEQFIAGVIREYLREFSKKFKTAPMEYLGAWETLIHDKKPEVENLVSDSL